VSNNKQQPYPQVLNIYYLLAILCYLIIMSLQLFVTVIE